ncbi:prephenate dehydrogenase [Agaricicola taiwanensis]|uniref:Prephenate dehydrogenase n=1 Tax=Agaricicola taiwanensis TaxID=591372 RepID=A0A8J3E0G5_9RHOB|nr:prephenate dehydrogenase [Agaricicola taiwanensis]GGE53774.1 prephenate dehydrogenase [Agaricicola taiwanensis]
MQSLLPFPLPRSVGIIGFGAFGRLMARHLAPHVPVLAHDPAPVFSDTAIPGVIRASLEEAAGCPVVVLACPVDRLAEAVAAIAPHLVPGALVLDVASVKLMPAEIMHAGLPLHVDVIATHPLFGPESAREGIRGLRIALCPLRGGRRLGLVRAFLSDVLGLDVIPTSADEHDRQMAAVQGLTHMIARLLMRLEPLPSRMTTRSFDLMMQAVGMVRHDAPEVFDAIERMNPHAAGVRRQFFGLSAELERELARPVLQVIEGGEGKPREPIPGLRNPPACSGSIA